MIPSQTRCYVAALRSAATEFEAFVRGQYWRVRYSLTSVDTAVYRVPLHDLLRFGEFRDSAVCNNLAKLRAIVDAIASLRDEADLLYAYASRHPWDVAAYISGVPDCIPVLFATIREDLVPRITAAKRAVIAAFMLPTVQCPGYCTPCSLLNGRARRQRGEAAAARHFPFRTQAIVSLSPPVRACVEEAP